MDEKTHAIYAGNLHQECSVSTLYKKFSPFGKILNIRVCKSKEGQSLCYGYINFSNKQDAENAIKMANYDLVMGQPIRLMWSTSKEFLKSKRNANLFIKNLHTDIDEKDMLNIFSAYGNVLSLKIVADKNGQSLGIGFVQFEDEVSALKAIEAMHGNLIYGRKVSITKTMSRAVKKEDIFNNIYLKNFDIQLEDEDLEKLCDGFGQIRSAKVMRYDNGTSKGFGFVSFMDFEGAKMAVQTLNGLCINGKKLFVGRAKKKEERQAEVLEIFMSKLKTDSS